MDNPNIAIVTICLNDLPGLQATCESLQKQHTPPAQWIVIDGGSGDGTLEWLRARPEQMPIWCSESDGGIYDAMNKGLKRVVADYVLFLNSGDRLASSNVLGCVVDTIRRQPERPVLLYGDRYEIHPDQSRQLRPSRPVWWIPFGMPTSHQAMYFLTDAIKQGFDTSYRLSGDYALVAKLFRQHGTPAIMRLALPLCDFRLGGRSEQFRSCALREDMKLRREIVGMGKVCTGMLFAMHVVHAAMKRRERDRH